MVNYNTNLNSWGSAGSEPPTGYNYTENEPPVDEFDNWFNNNVVNDIDHLTSLTNKRVESDKGTSKPSSPEDGQLFADTGTGDLEWYDDNTASWKRALNADGDSLGGALDANGYPINDSTADPLTLGGDVEISNGNLRLATGQAIEDGSSTARLNLNSNSTKISPEDGGYPYFRTSSTNQYAQFGVQDGDSFEIYDAQSADTAVTYTGSNGAGVLRTPNAGMRVESNGTLSDGEGIEVSYDPNGSPEGRINPYDRSNNVGKALRLTGNDLQLYGSGGLIDASLSPANFRLATGQAIEDGSGTERIKIFNSRTSLQFEDGDNGIVLSKNSISGFNAYSGTPIVIQDREAGKTAVEYTTSATAPGTLELTNSMLRADGPGDDINGIHSGTAIEVMPRNKTNSLNLVFSNDGGKSIKLKNNTNNLEYEDSNGNITNLA